VVDKSSEESLLFEEVAIDPECLVINEVIDGIHYKFGIGYGRCISAFPSDWRNKALHAANKIEDEYLKKRVKSLLCKPEILSSIILSDRKFHINSNWANEVIDISSSKPFDAVIAPGKLPVENSYIASSIDDYLSFSESRTGNIDFSKIKSTAEFIKLLSPFLKVNKKFALVHKWQWLLTDTRRVSDWFKAMMDYWIACGGVDATVIRSSNEQKGFDQERFDRESKLLNEYLTHRGYTGIFKYIAIDDSKNELHARCLLGSLCGIQLDYGLEMTPKRHPWSLMNKATFNNEYKLYLECDVRDIYPSSVDFVFKSKK
jgi:hypothetical protein